MFPKSNQSHSSRQGDLLGKSSGFCLRPRAELFALPFREHMKDLGLGSTLHQVTWPTDPRFQTLACLLTALPKDSSGRCDFQTCFLVFNTQWRN